MSPLKRSLAILPMIKGTTIKKENRADLDLSTPNNTAADMVAPLREIPGNMATACAIPITNALRNETPLSVVLAKSAKI